MGGNPQKRSKRFKGEIHMRENSIIKKDELVRRVANLCDVTQVTTGEVLDALTEVIYEAITRGEGINLIGVGKILPKYFEAKPARTRYFPITQEHLEKEAEPAHYRVRFKPSGGLLKKLKEDSYIRDIDETPNP